MKKPAAPMTEEDIEYCVGMLKEALSVPAAHSRVDELLGFFEAECKRVLSLFEGCPPKEIQPLADANETFWLERSYPLAPCPFSHAAHALAAVFSLSEAVAHRDSYADDFCTWAQEEADSLGHMLRLVRLCELETKAAKRKIAGSSAGRKSGQSRREAIAPRNQRIKKAGLGLRASGLAPHDVSGRLAQRQFGGKALSAKQLGKILRKEGVLPPSKKRRKPR